MRCVFGLAVPRPRRSPLEGPAGRPRPCACASATCQSSAGLYPRMRVAEQLSYFGQQHGMSGKAANASAAQWLERMGLGDRAKSKLEELSHGNQQRVQLATALVHGPEVLVLDEPFSGLDPIGIATMTDVVREQAAAGAGVVFSSHQLDLVEDVCEDVVIIARGRIVASGAIDELKAASGRQHLEIEVVGSNGDWLDGPRHAAGARADRRQGQAAGRPRRRPRRPARPRPRGRRGPDVRVQPPKLSELFMEAVTPEAAADDPGGGVMPRWRSIWLVARREILERGRSRGFILSVPSPRSSSSARSSSRPSCSVATTRRRSASSSRRRPASRPPSNSRAQRFDHKVAITTYPDATAADTALNDGGAEIVIEMPADLSGPGEIRVKRQPDQATAQVIAAATVALRVQAILSGATSTRRRSPTRSGRPRRYRSRPRPSRTRRSSWSPTSGRC